MERNKKVIWGILLVLSGVLIALCSIGVINFPFGISLWQIALAVVVMAVLIEGVLRIEFSQTFLMLGIEVIIFEEAIGALVGATEADWINNGVVIFTSLLIGIGLDLIFGGLKRRLKKGRFKLLHLEGGILAFVRYDGKKSYLTIANASYQQCDISFSTSVTSMIIKKESSSFKLPCLSAEIYLLRDNNTDITIKTTDK